MPTTDRDSQSRGIYKELTARLFKYFCRGPTPGLFNYFCRGPTLGLFNYFRPFVDILLIYRYVTHFWISTIYRPYTRPYARPYNQTLREILYVIFNRLPSIENTVSIKVHRRVSLGSLYSLSIVSIKVHRRVSLGSL